MESLQARNESDRVYLGLGIPKVGKFFDALVGFSPDGPALMACAMEPHTTLVVKALPRSASSTVLSPKKGRETIDATQAALEELQQRLAEEVDQRSYGQQRSGTHVRLQVVADAHRENRMPIENKRNGTIPRLVSDDADVGKDADDHDAYGRCGSVGMPLKTLLAATRVLNMTGMIQTMMVPMMLKMKMMTWTMVKQKGFARRGYSYHRTADPTQQTLSRK
ncbi:hypothetical protein AK812_SmicGene35140 [Symbiodinium microadriaticum]|uniref:Uncharacterized protein n=1 Tax=Symbiodinium microadriaticum TaxID=2951 RepID=A0A1Q9CME0_SYMMI|nr:hypothetical protein AK812_SmicGene35140 [Symbiodinium microadriaticum]